MAPGIFALDLLGKYVGWSIVHPQARQHSAPTSCFKLLYEVQGVKDINNFDRFCIYCKGLDIISWISSR